VVSRPARAGPEGGGTGGGEGTVYRWWSTKAEILFEASVIDAASELAPDPRETTAEDLTAYLEAVSQFLTVSAAGAAYRALLGEAQHDPAVADLLATADLLGDSARPGDRTGHPPG
jgi:hypothetical protein